MEEEAGQRTIGCSESDVCQARRVVRWRNARPHDVCRPLPHGPLGSPLTKVGIELTDSIYVVLSMRIMARMGQVAYQQLGDSEDFNRGCIACWT